MAPNIKKAAITVVPRQNTEFPSLEFKNVFTALMTVILPVPGPPVMIILSGSWPEKPDN